VLLVGLDGREQSVLGLAHLVDQLAVDVLLRAVEARLPPEDSVAEVSDRFGLRVDEDLACGLYV
jgi:hypothetical protein